MLRIRGSKDPNIEPGKDRELRVYAAELVSGAFERTIRLPESVDGERIRAKFESGLLTVSVPKARAKRGKSKIRTEPTKPVNVSSN